ncbi:MAG: hypothetical protein HS117_14945 [Verrucomicrobiaceae bacterium]|nr:hypothetical protein [Verrucomicrobiaceae bacterium]
MPEIAVGIGLLTAPKEKAAQNACSNENDKTASQTLEGFCHFKVFYQLRFTLETKKAFWAREKSAANSSASLSTPAESNSPSL